MTIIFDQSEDVVIAEGFDQPQDVVHECKTLRQYMKECLEADGKIARCKATPQAIFAGHEPQPKGYQKFFVPEHPAQRVRNPSKMIYSIYRDSEEFSLFKQIREEIEKKLSVRLFPIFDKDNLLKSLKFTFTQ